MGSGKSLKLTTLKVAKHGYRYHPFVLLELSKYQSNCLAEIETPWQDFQRLLALLVQDSTSKDIVSDVWSILTSPWVANSKLIRDELQEMINDVAEYRAYANYQMLPSSSEVRIWEISDPFSLLPIEIAEEIMKRQALRQQYSMLNLNVEHPDEDPKEQDVTLPVNPLPSETDSRNLLPLVPVTKGIRAKDDKKNTKLSSFFTFIGKRASPIDTEVLFRPFYAKIGVKLAPENHFTLSKSAKSNAFSWSDFRRYLRRIASLCMRKRCMCTDLNFNSSNRTSKLLQFCENYRPPFFGTLKPFAGRLSARKPISTLEGIEYDFDSDEDWCEEAEIEDAESIMASDEDSNDESLEENDDSSITSGNQPESETWLVPDGHLSDREGDDVGPATKLFPTSQPSTSARRKHLEKMPIIMEFPNTFEEHPQTARSELPSWHWHRQQYGNVDPLPKIQISIEIQPPPPIAQITGGLPLE